MKLRINDLHKMGHTYIDFKEAEKAVFQEQMQMRLLKGVAGEELLALRKEYQHQTSREAIVARDADILECIFQAREYMDLGVRHADSFIKVGRRFLKTKSAKSLVRNLQKWDSKDWWFHLKKF